MGQHDNTLKKSHGDVASHGLPQPNTYYVCSPSAPPFIPGSMTPSHYPYLYQEHYPQMNNIQVSGLPMYSTGEFLKPAPMAQYVVNVDGSKVAVDTKPTTRQAANPAAKKYPWWTIIFTFTFWISVAQVAVFAVAILQGGIVPVNENFNIGPPTQTLVDLGAKVSYLMRFQHQAWRFVSCIFLHAGFLHIVLNLIAQVRLGIILEREWGRLKFLTVYIAAGISGSLMSCLLQPDTISVGASGAILGLIGGYFANIILIWRGLDAKTKRIQLIQAFFILLAIGLLALAPHIDTSAHFGGVLMGFLIGFALLPMKKHTKFAYPIRFVATFLVIAYFVVGFWYFYEKSNPPTLTY